MDRADNCADRVTGNGYLHIPEEFGGRIRAARKARDLSVADMAHLLNLTSTALKHIEAGEWSELGPLVYVRGYVRACARELSISDSDTDGWFEASEAEQTSNERASILAPTRRSTLQSSHRALAYVAATALLAIPATWLVMRAFDFNLGVVATESASPPAREARLASIATLPVRTVPLAQPTETVTELRAPLTLILKFDGQAWLEARTLGGERLAYGLVASGSEQSLPLDRGLQVRLGNADAVRATLDGQPFDLAGFVTDDLAEFRLDPQ